MEEKKEKTQENTFDDTKKELLKQIEMALKNITVSKVQQANSEYLYKLVKTRDKLKKEDEEMYRDGDYYQGYGARGVPGTGRYRDGGYGESYGRRGVPGSGRRYRGEENLDEMKYHYGNYHESGSYGAKEDSAFKMTEAFKDFGYAISEELEPKDKMMFKKAMQEIMQMMDK